MSNHLKLGPLKRSDLNSIFTCQVCIRDHDDDGDDDHDDDVDDDDHHHDDHHGDDDDDDHVDRPIINVASGGQQQCLCAGLHLG